MLDGVIRIIANLLIDGVAVYAEAQSQRVRLGDEAPDRFRKKPRIERALDRDRPTGIGDGLPGKHDLRQPQGSLRRRQDRFRAHQFSYTCSGR